MKCNWHYSKCIQLWYHTWLAAVVMALTVAVLHCGGTVTATSTLTDEYADVRFLCGFCNGSGTRSAVRYPYRSTFEISHRTLWFV